MALSFLDNQAEDIHGACLVLLHSGQMREQQQLERLADEVSRQVDHQTIILSVRDEDGEQLRDYYDLSTLPAVLIVRDNDQLAANWSGHSIPPAAQIAHQLRQTS